MHMLGQSTPGPVLCGGEALEKNDSLQSMPQNSHAGSSPRSPRTDSVDAVKLATTHFTTPRPAVD